MELHFKIIGLLLMALGAIHIFFPKYFNWKEELKNISLINREMMVFHTFFIALTVFMMGMLCFWWTNDLLYSKFGKIISLGLGLFWSLRLFVQFFGYSSLLWKNKRFETFIHILFSLIWMYCSSVFIWNALS